MSELAGFIRWCREHRSILQRSLEMMESGVMHTGERHAGSPQRDTTAESITRAKKSITELDALLANHGGNSVGNG
jgi:hypothetical protein